MAAPLEFSVVGGWELTQPVFVSEVVPNSKPAEAGLKKGDEVYIVHVHIYQCTLFI